MNIIYFNRYFSILRYGLKATKHYKYIHQYSIISADCLCFDKHIYVQFILRFFVVVHFREFETLSVCGYLTVAKMLIRNCKILSEGCVTMFNAH